MATEQFYQAFLEEHLGGAHCRLAHGETDITTASIHAEIKVWSAWKSAIGQLLFYNHVSPKPDLRIYLYGARPKTMDMEVINGFLLKYDVTLYTLSHDNSVVTVRNECTGEVTDVVWTAKECNGHVRETLSAAEAQEAMDMLKTASKTDFVVKMSDVAQWLRSDKATLVRTLKASYKKGFDYKVVTLAKPAGRQYGNNNKEWLLTPDCFMRICMKSRSWCAEEMRSYFIRLQELEGPEKL
jgi:hypothetical protein